MLRTYFKETHVLLCVMSCQENLFLSFTQHLKELEKQILLSQTCHTQQSACQGKPEQWSLLMTLNRVLLQFKLPARWNFLLRTSGYPELREIHAKILGTTRYIISHDECRKGRHENTFCAWTRNKLVNPPALTFFGRCLCLLHEYWRWLQGVISLNRLMTGCALPGGKLVPSWLITREMAISCLH